MWPLLWLILLKQLNYTHLSFHTLPWVENKAILIVLIECFSMGYCSFLLYQNINKILGINIHFCPHFNFSHNSWITLKCWLPALDCSDCWLWNMIDHQLLASTISKTKCFVQLSIMSGWTVKEVLYSQRHHSNRVINAFFYTVRYRFPFTYQTKSWSTCT